MRFFYIPNFISKITKRLIWRIPSSERIIYLTFDDGPTNKATEWILETLKEYDAKATFFCVGENVKKYPELMNKILGNEHAVGNHTYSHVNGAKTTCNVYVNDVLKCSEIIQTNLFRPPYGKIKPAQAKAVKELGYEIVMWSVLTYDFDNISTDLLLKKSIRHTKSGDIIVFHDSKKSIDKLKQVLPVYLEHFKSRGFKLLPIRF